MATTIQFNCNHVSGMQSHSLSDRYISWVKRQVSQIAMQLDKIYCNTSHVQDRVAKNDRFEADCVVEKPSINPHVHIAWYLGERRRFSPRPIEIVRRQCLLLQTLNSAGLNPDERDQAFLSKWQDKALVFDTDAVLNWRQRGWSARTTTVFSDGWSAYIAKEQLWRSEFADQVFDLNDFHVQDQRTEPTRYFTMDRSGGAKTLDLDSELKPRR